MQLTEKIKSLIRDIPDFPRQGIVFKDITPLLEDPQTVAAIVKRITAHYGTQKIDAVAAIEARGFLFGMLLAQALKVPFIPVRKEGKLPFDKIKQEYALEYGNASVEMHSDAVKSGWQVLIHDDLLATGGTAGAAAKLIQQLSGEVAGFSFIVNLSFLPGSETLESNFYRKPHYLIQY